MALENLEQAVERFHRAAAADSRVIAAFVGGSLAAGMADEYSDIDIYAIVGDADYDSFFTDRMIFLRKIGHPVFGADFNGFGFDMVQFVLEEGFKGELALGKASDFMIVHGGPYRVLFDRTGILDGVTFPMLTVSEEENQRNLEAALTEFWGMFYTLTTLVGRDAPLAASLILDRMRRSLLRVCRLSVDFTDSWDNPPADRVLPASLAARYVRTFPPPERDAILIAAHEAAALFREIARPLAQTHGLTYPDSLERVVLNRFEALRQSTG